jgi:hypothetical protein
MFRCETMAVPTTASCLAPISQRKRRRRPYKSSSGRHINTLVFLIYFGFVLSGSPHFVLPLIKGSQRLIAPREGPLFEAVEFYELRQSAS